jgi:glutamate racemase
VFQRFCEAYLKLNPRKCQLLQKEVRYLGHIASSEGITTNPKKLRAVKEWPTPKNKHDIRSFLCLCTHYRWIISGFTNIAKPLTKLIEQKQSFQWTPEVEAAFQMLKGALCAAPVLAFLKSGEKFIVDKDASNVGIRGVLSQVHDGWSGL